MDLQSLLYTEAGEGLRSSDTVLRINRETDAQGRTLIRTKTADSFNFVFHQKLVLDGDEVIIAECNCGSRRNCPHLSLVAAELLGVAPQRESPPLPPAPKPVQPRPGPKPPERSPEPSLPEPPQPKRPPLPQPETPQSGRPPLPQPEPPQPVSAPFEPRSMRIRLGDRAEDGEPVFWLPNDTGQLFHVNTGIIGTMGTGKTQCTKSVIAQLWRERENNYDGSPPGILIFDYKGDYNETKPEFVRAVKARVLKPYRMPFNPFALIRGKANKPLLPIHTANQFIDTLSRINRLGPKQQQVLMDCIKAAYKSAGIDESNEVTWRRAAPTFETVYQAYSRLAADRTADSLSAVMEKLHNFCLFEEDPAKAVPLPQLLQGVVVMDLSQYDSDLQTLVVAIMLDQFYAQMQTLGSSLTDGKLRQLRYFILVDEADEFMSGNFPSLRRIIKEGREFGVGVLLSTQHLTHFVSDKEDYSRYVLTWIVHNVKDLSPRDVEYLFGLPPRSRRAEELCAEIKNLKKHESLLKLGSGDPEVIRDLPFFRLPETQ